ncbi:MAG: hypothetical protein KatS3mg019_1693 [Fimbriimonadales bacterium]|nr:MAG: hypothetical protein KatS3mg019_1693 [Fimbriimonadales bacterium]
MNWLSIGLSACAAGAVAAQTWYVLLAFVNAIELASSGRASFLRALSYSLVHAPWWSFMLWISAAAVLHALDNHYFSRKWRMVGALLVFIVVILLTITALILSRGAPITVAVQPVFLAAVFVNVILSWGVLRGVLWLIKRVLEDGKR